MEFREIATFLQAAQLKSFSKAARKLDYSQGAVTIQIKHLESELGVRLFDRIGKQVSLTHQGELFYRYAVSLTHNLEEIREAMAGTRELTGTLALGTIESICSSIIPPILSEYHRRFPQVSVSITIDSPQALLEMMNENALDIVYFLTNGCTTSAGSRSWRSRRRSSSPPPPPTPSPAERIWTWRRSPPSRFC